MRKAIVVSALCALLAGLWSGMALGQPNVFFWGTVKWTTGGAALGIELRLVQGEAVKAVAHTNQAGQYAFFDLPGSPSQYVLRAYLGGQLLAERGAEFLQPIALGGQAPDIVIQ